MRRQEHFHRVGTEACRRRRTCGSAVEQHVARETESIRMEPNRRQPNHHVAGDHADAANDAVLFHDSADGSREIEIGALIETRHFGRFAANERAAAFLAGAAHSPHHRLQGDRIQASLREVIQEGQRFGAMYRNVIDAVRHQVVADAFPRGRRRRQRELGAHTVDAVHEHGAYVLLDRQAIESGKQPETGEHRRVMGRGGQGLEAAKALGGAIDIDAGSSVA